MSEQDHVNDFTSLHVENYFYLDGFRVQQIKPPGKPNNIVQNEEPWSRPHNTATLPGTHHCVMNYQAPRDSLDFQLSSVYDHHKHLFWSKHQTSYQKETVSEDHRKGINFEKLMQEQENGIRVWVDPNRDCIRYLN
ncbi:cilia- and flagella-associated protein 276 [Anableps anableps]